jgi:hypothetical protein
MNKVILGLILLATALAGAKGNEEFHSLIVESAEARKTLSQKLRKSVDLIDTANQDRQERQEKVVFSEAEAQIENVAVPSRMVRNTVAKRAQRKATSKINQENMQRLSQELEEAR